MNLQTALEVVWDDVADSVYQQATIDEAVHYARVEMSSDELHNVLVMNPATHAAYVAVRTADELDLKHVADRISRR